MVDQTEIFNRVQVWHWGRVDSQAGEWEYACRLPFSNGGFNLGRPHQVWLVGSCRALSIRNLHIVVGASNLVLGAISALGEVFIASDMAALAGITALARFGVAAARGTTTGTSHFAKVTEVSVN